MQKAGDPGVLRRRLCFGFTLHASLAVCGLLFAAAAGGVTASAVAETPTTTTVVSTTLPVSTQATTTAQAEPTTQTTSTATTLATVTTLPTRTQTKTPVVRAPSVVTDRALTSGCPISAMAVLRPGRTSGLVGPITAGPADAAEVARLRYVAGGPVFSGDDVRVSGGGCGSLSVGARVSIASLSLFGGALSADAIHFVVGRRDARSISGLRVGHLRVSASSKGWLPLGRWGEWRVGSMPGAAVAALTVRLRQRHAGLPAGTVLLVAVAGSSARAVVSASRRHGRGRHRRAARRPLHITPPLAVAGEVFPVVGARAAFGDTYGAFRNDVAGDWHHGDDIFAPLGAPVVAVADGTINRVGWNKVGGWRLWVRDGAGDEFYYAHLSGYTRADFRSIRVRAGEVIGFVGNTGDAYATAPHLHFEIHPRTLLHLGYDGAVDPTRYLEHWPRIGHADTPRPAHPSLPTQPAMRAEARRVWHELLYARHLERRPALARASSPAIFPPQMVAAPPAPEAPRAHASETRSVLLLALPLTMLICLGAGLGFRRRC